jgi:tetratricopeptide (TPR) repeat protein
MKGEAIGAPYRNAVALLRPWAAAAAGDVAGSIAQPEARSDPLGQAYAQLNRALLLERAGKIADADTAFKSLVGQDTRIPLFALTYAYFLERQNRRPEAIVLYDGLLGDRPDDRVVKAARERARARKPAPPMLTPQQGAAMSLLALASTSMNQNQQAVAVAYLQLALRTDPERNEARLLIADWMEALGNHDGARALYAAVPRTAPEYLLVRRGLAASYSNENNEAKALAVAQETVREYPDDIDAQLLLADMLRQNKDFSGAVTVLNKVIAAEGKDVPWQLYFSRAIALEKSGQWPAAEKDLKTALASTPNEPQLQNYLGYTWADRGENLPQALEMLNKAARAQPNSGAILDSLGWAYFRAGDTAKAMGYLEQAVVREPSDPDINNHLGDIYFKVGRTLEARYQWIRVLSLDPEPAMRAEATAKLAAHPEEPKAAVAVAEPARTTP